jgi:carbonic anhydrase
MSVENLLSYDYIKSAVDNGSLSVHGWLMDITTGKLIELT